MGSTDTTVPSFIEAVPSSTTTPSFTLPVYFIAPIFCYTRFLLTSAPPPGRGCPGGPVSRPQVTFAL